MLNHKWNKYQSPVIGADTGGWQGVEEKRRSQEYLLTPPPFLGTNLKVYWFNVTVFEQILINKCFNKTFRHLLIKIKSFTFHQSDRF